MMVRLTLGYLYWSGTWSFCNGPGAARGVRDDASLYEPESNDGEDFA